MPEFHFQEMFPLGPEDVPYRCLTTDHVASGSFAGETVVTVAPDALTLLAAKHFMTYRICCGHRICGSFARFSMTPKPLRTTNSWLWTC